MSYYTPDTNNVHIIITDTLQAEGMHLVVYHYDDFTTDHETMNVRGIVVDALDNNKIVCKTFGFTPEVLANNHDELNAQISPLVTLDTKFYKAYEGTLLRVWCYKSKWFLSTHRKLDAFKSRWGSPITYGDLFCRALSNREEPASFDEFVAGLNPEKVYVFLMRSYKENRKVCMGGDKPQLYNVGAFDRTQNYAFTASNEETKCPYPEQLTFGSPDELVDFVIQSNPQEIQGVVLSNPNGSMGKLVNPMYDHFDKIRGNVPNVLHRYVQLRWKPEVAAFKTMYPEHQAKFDEWEAAMNSIISNVLRKYIDRFVYHQTAILPPEQYQVMQQLQQYYIANLRPQNLRAQPEHIWEILGKWQEKDVNVLFKEYQRRKRQTGDGNQLTENMINGIKNSFTTRKIFETF